MTLSHNQLNEGANPKTGRADRPINDKSSRRGKLREGSWAGVTSGTTDHTCTTATALQLHCTSGCHGFVCVFSPVAEKMWVGPRYGQLKSLPPNRCAKERQRGGTETQQSRKRHSRQLTVLAVCTMTSRPGLSSVTGE